MPITHLETEHPCESYPRHCPRCRFRPWCMMLSNSPPKEDTPNEKNSGAP